MLNTCYTELCGTTAVKNIVVTAVCISCMLDALTLLEDYTNGRIRRIRVFKDHKDLLAHDDDWLMSRFQIP